MRCISEWSKRQPQPAPFIPGFSVTFAIACFRKAIFGRGRPAACTVKRLPLKSRHDDDERVTDPRISPYRRAAARYVRWFKPQRRPNSFSRIGKPCIGAALRESQSATPCMDKIKTPNLATLAERELADTTGCASRPQAPRLKQVPVRIPAVKAVYLFFFRNLSPLPHSRRPESVVYAARGVIVTPLRRGCLIGMPRRLSFIRGYFRSRFDGQLSALFRHAYMK